jgi:catechol 2,3-dioxygenase-like lactoylglutathione lyase family enzyme
MTALGPIIPILRMFDEQKAREFYVGFLGFNIDFEHRFEPGLPLYMQVSRAGAVLHLSEHHGDATPGSAVRIGVGDLDALASEFREKDYKFARPSIQEQPWGLRELIVGDPFGNRIVFFGVGGL